MRAHLQTVVRIVVTLAAIAIVVIALRGVDLQRTLSILLNANLSFLLATLVAQLVAIAVVLVRWKYQLHPAQRLSLGILLPPLVISYALDTATLRGIGVAPRIYLLRRRVAIDTGFIAGTLAQEFVLDATVVLLWAVVVPFLVDLPPEFRQVQLVLALPLTLVLLADLALWRRKSLLVALMMRLGLWDRVLGFLPDWIRRKLGAFGDGLTASFAYPVTLAVVIGCTLLVWAIQALVYLLLFLSLDIPFDYLQASAAMAFAQTIIAVPAVPGAVGTLDAALVTLILVQGGNRAAALAYVAIFRVFLVVPNTVLGAILAWREGWRIGRWTSGRSQQ